MPHGDRRSVTEQTTPGTEPSVNYLKEEPSQAKRNRDWEKQQRREKGSATYRGIPASLNEQLAKIAKELNVPVGEVARSFLEYGLAAYKRGDLELEPQLIVGRFTLHPTERR